MHHQSVLIIKLRKKQKSSKKTSSTGSWKDVAQVKEWMLKSIFKVSWLPSLSLNWYSGSMYCFGFVAVPAWDVLRLYSPHSYLLLFTLGKVLCRQHLKVHLLDWGQNQRAAHKVVGEAPFLGGGLGLAKGKVLNVKRRLLSPPSSALCPLVNIFCTSVGSQLCLEFVRQITCFLSLCA